MKRNLRRTTPKSLGWTEGHTQSYIEGWEETYRKYLHDAQRDVEYLMKSGGDSRLVGWFKDYRRVVLNRMGR